MVKINKVLLVGAKQVGKTAILEQLIYGHVAKDSVSSETTFNCFSSINVYIFGK